MMLSAKAAAAVLVWALAGIISTTLFVFVTPVLEARFAPILTDQRVVVDEGDRTPGRMCWTWYWTKRRYAQPVVASWSIAIEGTSVEIPAVTERERDRSVLRNPQAHSLGPGRNDLCVIIPPYFDTVQGLTIRGHISYRTSHGLWTVWQELPTVRVPPI